MTVSAQTEERKNGERNGEKKESEKEKKKKKKKVKKSKKERKEEKETGSNLIQRWLIKTAFVLIRCELKIEVGESGGKRGGSGEKWLGGEKIRTPVKVKKNND